MKCAGGTITKKIWTQLNVLFVVKYWFKHGENLSEDGIENDTNEDNKRGHESQKVFQKVLEDLDPPILKKMKNQKL